MRTQAPPRSPPPPGLQPQSQAARPAPPPGAQAPPYAHRRAVCDLTSPGERAGSPHLVTEKAGPPGWLR